MENLDQRIQKGLVVAFAEVVNQDEKEVNPTELWNWIQTVCKSCTFNSSEGLYINSTDAINQIELHKLKQMKEHYNTPAAKHPGEAKTLELLNRNHQWPEMRKDVDRYIQNCHICQCSKANHQKVH
jgi:hypothetical protein